MKYKVEKKSQRDIERLRNNLEEAFPGYAWKIKIKPSDCSSYLEIALVAKRISRKLLTELSLSWGVEILRRTREWLHLLATWCQQLQAIRASVVFRVQCETYFNERAAMESRWYEGREKERRGRGARRRGRERGTRWGDSPGIEAAMFAVEPPDVEGRTRDDHWNGNAIDAKWK